MGYKTDEKRIFGLDIVRAFAIILVVLGHGAYMLKDTPLVGFPYFDMIDGVDMFFVLSGFLIGRILLKEINKPEGFRSKQLLNFWKRRWFRTLPNYYLILLLNYLVVRYGIIKEDITQFNFHFITFTQNFKSPYYDFFWESWSLSIEEWFYILTPMLILIFLVFLKPKQSFLYATLIMIVFPVLYRIYIFDGEIDNFWWDVTFKKTVLTRLDSIGYGLFLGWIQYYYVNLWRKIKVPSFALGIALVVFILNYKQPGTTIYSQIVFLSLTPFSVMLILPMFESYKRASGLVAVAIQHISKISYSMYLINLALVAEVIRDNFTPLGGADSLMKYFVYWVIVIGVSTLLYRYFEKPMMNLRDKKFIVASVKKMD